MELIERIAKRVKTARTSKKMTVKQLAELSGVSERTIYHIEAADMFPRIENLDLLMRVLGIRIVVGGKR